MFFFLETLLDDDVLSVQRVVNLQQIILHSERL